MSNKLQALKKEFLVKENQLEHARKQLKKEFFGIDKVIDQVINNTRSWFILNDYQEKPLIINLWGLTGVGKTSLIQRMAALLSYSDWLFRFDLGDKNSTGFRDNLEDLCKKNEDEPLMLILDEFQHARTLIGASKQEINKDANRKIWDLIDAGKIEYYSWKIGLYRFINHINKLECLLQAGVVVEKGKIVEGADLYTSEIFGDLYEEDERKEICYFIEEDYYGNIINYAPEEFGFKLYKDVRQYLCTLDGPQIIAFLNSIIKDAKKPEIKNFTKSIIFIIGNLDEAYQMSNNLMADIDADSFYRSSLKINVSQIKEALTHRFRSEQIARLGNTHIIYPSLNKKAYQQLIDLKLKEITQKTTLKFELQLSFTKSIKQLIYKEGVVPTQGMRPVITTIDSLIQANLSSLLTTLIQKNITAEELQFSYQNEKMHIDYYHQKKCVLKETLQVLTPLEDLRKPKQNDLQAITAVHESGHAILIAVLLKTIPEVVYSVTSSSSNIGLVHTHFSSKYIAKREVINRVAAQLGGLVAEELVFGKDNVTTGASSDIQVATNLITRIIKEEGMGSLPLRYDANKNIPNVYHPHKNINLEIEQMIKEGWELAKKTLQKEYTLLLKLADHLSDVPSIQKDALREFINTYKSTPVQFIENADLLYYRNHLKNEIQQLKKSTLVSNRKHVLQKEYSALTYQKSNHK